MDMLAVIVDGNIGIYNTEDAAKQTGLVLQQPYGRSADYSDYITEHPEISLRFSGDLSVTAEQEFVSEMTTKSSDIDIFLLSDLNILSTIHRKSYGVDLAADSQINALIDDMYAPFKQALKRDGKIYAIPQYLYVMMLGYKPEFFETFDLEVPTTYDGMLDLAKLWIDEYAGDSPEGYFNLFGNDFELTTILKRYADECLSNGQELVCNTAEMAAFVQKYLDVSKLYEAYDYPQGSSIFAFNIIDIPHKHENYG